MFHHLNGQAVRLHLPSPQEPGYSIIKPGEKRVIRGSGLPGRPELGEPAGDLWIKFEIEWPTEAWMASQNLEFLRHALPGIRPDLGPSLPASSSQVYLTLTPEHVSAFSPNDFLCLLRTWSVEAIILMNSCV